MPISAGAAAVDDPRGADDAAWGRWFALSFLIWGAAALYAVSRSYVQGQLGDVDRLFMPQLGAELRALLLWALGTPLIVALARRYPLERGSRARRLSLHVAGSVAFVYLLQVGINAPYLLRGEWGVAALAARSGEAFVAYYHLAGLVYGVIVAAVLLLDARVDGPANVSVAASRQFDGEAGGAAGVRATGSGDPCDDDSGDGGDVCSRIAVKIDDGIVVVDVADIAWIEADGDYVKLHAGGRALLMRDSLKNLEGRLDPTRFVRIHRSSIVNVQRVQRLHPFFHGDYAVVLDDGTELRLSRTRREALAALIGHPL